MKTQEKFVIEGLAGKKTLAGSVTIGGAKNAALKAFAAAILFGGPVTLENVPNTNDIQTISAILKKLGATVSGNNPTFTVDAGKITSTDIDPELAVTMRASVVLTGPLLVRYGKVTFPAPGGCVIGARPIDLFLSGYEKMGATVTLDEKKCVYSITAPGGLKSADITFSKISVGATETLMMAAVLAEGKTILNNCAREPEIVNVAEWLNSSGAKISGAGTSVIQIEGGAAKLLAAKASFVTIPDRIETGSYLLLGALCAKNLNINKCRPEHLASLITMLKDSGVPVETTADSISIANNTASNSSFKSFDVKTQEYPGFPTDLQAQMVAYLTQASGESSIFETIFEGRFKYVEDLSKMGALITVMNPHEILVKGPASLRALPDAEELRAHDIRAGFAVVMAALVAKGTFTVNNIHLIDRGYEKLEERLTALGAQIHRVSK